MSVSRSVPLVSIIMAAYNAENTIESAIQSVIKQTFTDWELFVINDCSTDHTADIVSSFSDKNSNIHLINNESNLGVSLTRKKGMELANGEWIAILDSDDMWKTEKLEKQINLVQNLNAQLVFTGSSFINDEGNPIDWQLHVPNKISYSQLLKQNLISNSSALVNTQLYKQYYCVGDNMHEDFATWLRITKSGIEAYGIDEPLLVYRLAKSSKSSNKLKAAKMNWNTYRYVGLNPLSAFYYMCWYTIKGVLKYSHLYK